MATDQTDKSHRFRDEDQNLLVELRATRRKHRSQKPSDAGSELTTGQRVADSVAATMGS